MSSHQPPSPSDFPPGYLDEYCGYQLLGTSIAFMILGPFFVALRFYTRLTTDAKQGWDDYLVPPALVANLALQGSAIALITYGGVGTHVEYWEIHNPLVIFSWAKTLFAVELTYILAVAFGKLTILAIYLRVFNSKPTLYTTYVLIGIVVAACFGSFIANIFQSLPVGCQWNPAAGENCHSFDILAYFRYLSVPNIVTDVAILILPLPMIWQLKLSKSQKLGLTGVFLTGSIGLISSCVRFAIFFQSNALDDPTWKSSFLNVWTVTEPGTYLVAGCLPALRPIFLAALRKVHPSRLSNSDSRGYGRGGASGGPFGAARYGAGSKMNTFESSGKRKGKGDPSVLESGSGAGRFERLTGDDGSLGADERSLISREGKASPMRFQQGHSGIEVRRDFNISFSARNEEEATAFELESRGVAR